MRRATITGMSLMRMELNSALTPCYIVCLESVDCWTWRSPTRGALRIGAFVCIILQHHEFARLRTIACARQSSPHGFSPDSGPPDRQTRILVLRGYWRFHVFL